MFIIISTVLSTGKEMDKWCKKVSLVDFHGTKFVDFFMKN